MLLLLFSGAVPGAIYPDPATVLAGVAYGPNGNEYTGTLVVMFSAADIAAALATALSSSLVAADVVRVNGIDVAGSGTRADPWGPA